MINFRYRRLRKLGEGGGGEVFLVEDLLKESRPLAMKILHGTGPSDGSSDEQFRNEVSVLASLRHPNLVRVSDFGLVRKCDEPAMEGRRYFTMEYLEGADARAWWQANRGLPGGPALLVGVVLQALDVLAYIHRRGIIHFDVKPENFLLMAGGMDDEETPRLKLTDFGFSVEADAAIEIPLRGTLEYTAPELLRRQPFDHRIDLYSLGAALFDLVEGRCPYEAVTPVDLIKKVLTDEPRFQMCREKEYLPLLPLLTNLLQKDPSRRYASAEEARAVLDSSTSGAVSRSADLVPVPEFVGRKNEREIIGASITPLVSGAAADSPGAILVEGPEGIGKTALLAEMTRVARSLDIPVFESAPGERGLPFGVFLSLLPLLRAEGMSRSLAGRQLVERFADLVGGETGPDTAGPATLRVNWIKEKEKAADALARFLNQLSVIFPFVLVVDDAHLLDAESEEIFRIARRDAHPGAWLLLAAARGDRQLSIPFRRISLEELDEKSVLQMSASAISAGEIGTLLGARLYGLYGGLPLLIVEALRSVSAGIPPGGDRFAGGIEETAGRLLGGLPRSLDELLLGRYRSVDPEPQLTLKVLSCFSLPARPEVVYSVLPFQKRRAAALLSSLELGGFVVSHDDGRRIEMKHARLKGLVYAGVGADRRETHTAIADALEQDAGQRTFTDLQELAFQSREGGDRGAGIAWLEAAGDEGVSIAAYRMAAGIFREALSADEESPSGRREVLTVKCAHALYKCGDFREASEIAEELLGKDVRGPADRLSLHRTAGLSQSRLGNFDEAKHHIASALDLSGDPASTVELRQELVGIEIASGNFAEAERLSAAQLERARELRDPAIIASIHNDLGIATFFQGSLDAAAAHFGESLKIYADGGKHAEVADAMMNIANVMSAKGELTRAVEYWTDALSRSQEFGTLNQQGQIQNNLGIAHYKLRRMKEARAYYDQARAIFSRLESRQGSAFVLTNLGEVNFAEGRYEDALSLWDEGLALYREMDDAQGIVESLLQVVQVHLVMCAAGPAGSLLDEAESLIGAKSLDTFRFQLLSLRGMCLMCLGSFPAAAELFAHAQQVPPGEGEDERRLLVGLRIAECGFRTGDASAAEAGAIEAKDSGMQKALPQVTAEALYLLGRIARTREQGAMEKPLTYFKEGLDLIADEPVTETTWRLAFALGEEYRKRGQADRAKGCFVKARLVLRYFLAGITSSQLRNSYLMADDRQKVLQSLESYLNR